MGMRAMQERVWQRRGEQYLLIKSPPASGKSRTLMFVALDKLANQKLRQAIGRRETSTCKPPRGTANSGGRTSLLPAGPAEQEECSPTENPTS